MTELDPGDYLSYYGQAMTLERQGDSEGAVRMFAKAIALNPDLFSAYCGRAWAYRAMGDPDGAIAESMALLQTFA